MKCERERGERESMRGGEGKMCDRKEDRERKYEGWLRKIM